MTLNDVSVGGRGLLRGQGSEPGEGAATPCVTSTSFHRKPRERAVILEEVSVLWHPCYGTHVYVIGREEERAFSCHAPASPHPGALLPQVSA